MSLLAVAALTASVNCYMAAAYRYELPEDLLVAMASVESSHNPKAIAHANNGTYSIGLMQINSSWFSTLEGYGIQENDLWNPCTNIQVGAWILRQEVDRYGYSWEAIGAYYAGAYTEKNYHWKVRHYREYAQKVLSRWKAIVSRKARSSTASPTPANVRVSVEAASAVLANLP